MLQQRERKLQKLPDKLRSSVDKFTESLWKVSLPGHHNNMVRWTIAWSVYAVWAGTAETVHDEKL